MCASPCCREGINTVMEEVAETDPYEQRVQQDKEVA